MEAASVEQKVENAFEEPNSAKRMKKEPGATTGKSVVVLRNTDVMRRNLTVFMPNTIEMAQLKKAEKGQFKTNIQISSKMTEIDIKHKLLENFPILEHQRFYCASAVENRTRLEFHGEPRIWDGRYIKRTIKGNSALYILIEEEKQAQDSGHNSADSEQSKLKRSYDQITSSEQLISGVSSVKMAGLIISSTAQQIPENQPNIFTMPGNPPRGNAAYPIMVSGLAQKDMEKSDSQHPGERQVMHQDVLPSLILVPNPLQQTLPMASVLMVPTAGGIAVAPAASGGNNVMTMTSAHQSLGTSPLHAAKGPDVRQTGLQMVSSMLTPQMNSLNISNAASQQSQKLVTAETLITKTNQTVQSGEVIEAPQQALPIITMTASNRNYSVGGQQEVLKFKSPAPSRESRDEKTSSSQGTDKGASVSAVTVDRQHYRSVTFLASDNESSSSDPSADSGIELSEKSEEPTSQSKDKSLYDAMVMQRHEHKVVKLNEAEWTDINEGDIVTDAAILDNIKTEDQVDPSDITTPCQMFDISAEELDSALHEICSNSDNYVDLLGVVQDICPSSGSVKGGLQFHITLTEELPEDDTSGVAHFDGVGDVYLDKMNPYTFSGNIPASQDPGPVLITVCTQAGRKLGMTSFTFHGERTYGSTCGTSVNEDKEERTQLPSAARVTLPPGFSVDDKDATGRTPLMIASLDGKLENAKILIECGADPSLRSNIGWHSLHYASADGNPDLIELLLNNGLDIDSRTTEGLTPLMITATNGNLQAVECLTEKGADPSLENNSGWNVLHCASQSGDPRIIQLILTLVTDIESRSADGSTPLMITVKSGNLQGIKYLLERGADPSSQDNEGRNSLHCASSCGDPGVVELLLSHVTKK